MKHTPEGKRFQARKLSRIGPTWGLMMLSLPLSLAALSACAATTSTVLSLQSLDCASCSDQVMVPLGELEGVLRMDFKLHEAELVVYHTPSVSDEMLLKAASDTEFKVVIGEGQGFYAKVLQYPEGSDVQDANTPGGQVDLTRHLAPGKVTVFDFYADWCGPCRRVAAYLAKRIQKDSTLAVRKVDVLDWDSPVVKQHLNQIKSLPYVLIYGPNGQRVDAIQGLHLDRLEAAIQKAAEGAQ